MPSIRIPLLKVSAEPDGRLRLPNHALDTDAEWWGSVLADPRARSRWNPNEDQLGRHRGEQLTLSCASCHRGGSYIVDELIAQFGASCPCSAAVARIIDDRGGCRRGRDCGLTYETTNNYRPPER